MERNGQKDFVASWVDDLVYSSNNINFYEKFEKTLSKKFLISEVDDLNWFLRMQIRREKGTPRTFPRKLRRGIT